MCTNALTEKMLSNSNIDKLIMIISMRFTVTTNAFILRKGRKQRRLTLKVIVTHNLKLLTDKIFATKNARKKLVFKLLHLY